MSNPLEGLSVRKTQHPFRQRLGPPPAAPAALAAGQHWMQPAGRRPAP